MQRIITSTLIAAVIIVTSLFMWVSYPADFSRAEVFIPEGTFPGQVANQLYDSHVIRSPFYFRVLLKIRGTAGKIIPGDYLFDKKQSIFKVASRITKGDFGIEQRKVTIPEGLNNTQIAAIIKEKFPDFDDKKFINDTKGKQGYLFPDTYNIVSTSTTKIISQLSDSFDYNVRSLQAESLSAEKKWSDIIMMASILEEEANTVEDFKIVSGILWNRLRINMALQVDVAPITYERPGFPTEPISNPGLETIEAALHPQSTKYMYYLTGKDGLMHYAVTFDEHKANIQKYLR